MIQQSSLRKMQCDLLQNAQGLIVRVFFPAGRISSSKADF